MFTFEQAFESVIYKERELADYATPNLTDTEMLTRTVLRMHTIDDYQPYVFNHELHVITQNNTIISFLGFYPYDGNL